MAGQASRPGWRIYATIRPDNKASGRVAEAAGLRPTSTVTDDLGDLTVYDL
jgi:RimJ/RimL family protein N-acetyltransferase